MPRPFLAVALLALGACVSQPAATYTPPEDSGLVGGRNYPGDDYVCQVIGENSLTSNYLDDSALLVGCPVSETGAIADLEADGAYVLDQIGDWVLLSVPKF